MYRCGNRRKSNDAAADNSPKMVGWQMLAELAVDGQTQVVGGGVGGGDREEETVGIPTVQDCRSRV